MTVSDLTLQNSGWSETIPLSHLYVEFRGGPACGPDGDYLMEFYVKNVGSLYPCLCGRRVAKQPEPKPYWHIYPRVLGDPDAMVKEVVRATHRFLQDLIELPEPDSIFDEDIAGVQITIDQITVQRPQEQGLYRRTMWWSWISRVSFSGTPVCYRKCKRCSMVVLVKGQE